MRYTLSALLLTTAVCGLAACSSGKASHMKVNNESNYWQRASASSAVYMRGPKAQQMLNRDIAMCVSELKELERLGAVREAFPADRNMPGSEFEEEPQSPEEKMNEWNTPDRSGYLLTEVHDYADFETCMRTHGWERTEYLPYDRADSARDNYVDTYDSINRRIPAPVDGGRPYSGRVYPPYNQ